MGRAASMYPSKVRYLCRIELSNRYT